MDHELIAYLDLHFGRIDHRFDGLERRLEALEHRFDGLERRLEALEHRMGALEHRIDALERRVETLDQRSARAEETAQQSLVQIEALRHQMQLIAEGFIGLSDRMARHQSDATLAFDQVRSWIDPFYKDLESRVRFMEGWAERQQVDSMDTVRKLVGKLAGRQPLPAE